MSRKLLVQFEKFRLTVKQHCVNSVGDGLLSRSATTAFSYRFVWCGQGATQDNERILPMPSISFSRRKLFNVCSFLTYWIQTHIEKFNQHRGVQKSAALTIFLFSNNAIRIETNVHSPRKHPHDPPPLHQDPLDCGQETSHQTLLKIKRRGCPISP